MALSALAPAAHCQHLNPIPCAVSPKPKPGILRETWWTRSNGFAMALVSHRPASVERGHVQGQHERFHASPSPAGLCFSPDPRVRSDTCHSGNLFSGVLCRSIQAKAVNEVDAERDCATPAKSKKGGGVVLYSLTLRLSRGPLTCVGACTAGSVGSSHHAGTKCNSWRRNGEFSRQRHFAGQRGVEGSVCLLPNA